MFANPLWSILLLAIPVGVWFFIIKPRLGAKLTEVYGDRPWFQRWKARLYAFRTFWIATLTAIMTALPDLLVKVSSFDFSFLPQPWPLYTSLFFTITVSLMKAMETKPGEDT